MRSDDGGVHWTWPQTLIDTAIDDRDAGVVETPKGSLLVTTFTSLAFDAYAKFGGFQSFFSNLTEPTQTVCGGLFFIKPNIQ